MKKVIIIILCLFLLNGCSNSNTKNICFKENCFQIELALNQEEREIGLMNRTSLDKYTGMLFVFDDEDYHDFWMKNTLIPLDIIWINSNNKVVFIKENAEVCTKDECEIINPTQKAKYVLEVNSGLINEFDIRVGDNVEFKM